MAKHLIASDISIRTAKPKDKAYRISDGGGLYMLVQKNGAKWWRLDYAFEGKRKTLSLGVYPKVTLKKARAEADKAGKSIADGIDPSNQRKEKKEAEATAIEREQRLKKGIALQDSFEEIARAWHSNRSVKLSERHADRILQQFIKDVFPWLGHRHVGEIEAPEVLEMLRRVEGRGAIETTHRIKANISRVFSYAIATGKAKRNPCEDIKSADVLTPVVHKRMATITDPRRVGELLRAIAGYQGSFVTRCALQIAPYVFVRPGELRHAEWTEFDLDAAEWRIPAHKMKVKEKHIVPLSQQAVAVLRELQALTGSGFYVFPGVRSDSRPMSENTVNAALRRMGYEKSDICGHGFRAMASTMLHEQGWKSDVIERQLAHRESNKVKAAYNHAQHLPERKQMMQQWADYLDGLRSGATVIPINRKA
jgi:integrase